MKLVSIGVGARLVPLIMLILTTGNSGAQDRPANGSRAVGVPALGMDVFRYLLLRHGLEPLQSFDEVVKEPKRTVIVLLGDASLESEFLKPAMAQLEKGASLLIATDRPTGDKLKELGVKITGDRVLSPDADKCFAGWKDFPFVEPLESTKSDAESPRRIFDGFMVDATRRGAIATNETAVLQMLPGHSQCQPLASYPAECEIKNSGGKTRKINRKTDFFAAGGSLEKGRFLVLADHSVFLNWMLLKSSIANREFADSSIDWLQGPVPEKADKSVFRGKDRCLFIEDGEIKAQFALPGDDPISELDLFLAAMSLFQSHGDRIVSDLERRDAFNQSLLAGTSVRQITRAGLIVLSLGLLAIGARKLMRSRFRSGPANQLVLAELTATVVHKSLLRQRIEAQMKVGR